MSDDLQARILIVEDERLVRESMGSFLAPRFEVDYAADGAEAIAAVKRRMPDLVILDIGLPGDLDGFEVCQWIRQEGFRAPILFLTSRDEVVDKLRGFGVGGDDYIVKPVSLVELEARVHASLRRASGSLSAFHEVIAWGPVEVDLAAHEVRVDGEPVSLSVKEMELLKFFLRNRDAVLTREQLLTEVWHYDVGVSSRTLDTHILNLRKKLRDGEDGVLALQTVRGVGYRFSPD